MAKKAAKTKAERDYHAQVAKLPCATCGASPASVHHIREDQGAGQRAGHFLVIPLCHECHQGSFSIHNSREQFLRTYKTTELKLLNETLCHIFGARNNDNDFL